MMPPAIPLATYRFQFTKDFGFDAAAALVPYLKDLGISHLYASPFLKARAGSTHGYDVVDHNAFNPELGGEAAFLRLSDALAQADLGLILDFVPNHMGVHFADNPWWLDTLEWGPKSPYAQSFDIDWDTLPAHPRGGVLVPMLGRPYGEALENGEIELRYDQREGSFSAWYFEHRLPIEPTRYGEIIEKSVATADAAETDSRPRPARHRATISRAAESAARAGCEPQGRIGGGARSRRCPGTRARRLPSRRRRRPRQRWPCIIFWSGSTTGWRTGGSRAAKSTTGASSTSTRSPGCGWSTATLSRRSTDWCAR